MREGGIFQENHPPQLQFLVSLILRFPNSPELPAITIITSCSLNHYRRWSIMWFYHLVLPGPLIFSGPGKG